MIELDAIMQNLHSSFLFFNIPPYLVILEVELKELWSMYVRMSHYLFATIICVDI